MEKRKGLILLLGALLAAVAIIACQPVEETTNVVNQYSVGDSLAGGWTVQVVDSLGGYLATRDYDADDDDVIDEYQAKVSGQFSQDMTWGSSTAAYGSETAIQRVYYLLDAVFIGNDNSGNCVLTIEPGTVIKGEVSTSNPGVLVITRGSRINAVGTASNPIVFTSARDEGSRAASDWGGLVINGNARINDGDDNGEAEGEGSTGTYGGSDDDDNSGTLQYVRVEFAGTLFSADNELNGIAFQGVGRGTTVDHIQVHRNGDDGVEFFGGCVNVSYVVITGAGDDSLDWTSGWTGSAQYVILQQYDDGGDCGIEADSNKNDAAAEPVSNPTLANFTIIGRGEAEKVGVQFRRGTNATLANSVITGFGINSNENSKDSDAGTITFSGVLSDADSVSTPADETDWQAALTANTASEAGTLNLPAASAAGANEGSVDVQPSADPSATGVSTADLSTAAADANLDIEASDFFGAIDPADPSAWYAGWTDTPAN